MEPEQLRRLGLDGLASLESEHGFDASDASGLYPALYGRDSLWVLLLLLQAQVLRPDPQVEGLLSRAGPRILTSLAALQGTVEDDAVEEQPGRIPHEHHPVPTAHAQESALPLARGCSYAGFDETFLFVLAHDAFIAADPSHPVGHELRPNVQRALGWMDRYADAEGDGLFEYLRRNPANLLNQVWKDSFDSATHTGFDVPPHPLAWLEVQAYAYAVFATQVPVDGGTTFAPRDRPRADRIAQLVDDRYWLGDEAGFAMALDGAKVPVRMAASNAGHALWAGVVRAERVESLVTRMTQPDILSFYGLRTLSSASPYYAPFAYHRGAVWPFDSMVFALGLLRHDRTGMAFQVAEAVGRAISLAGTPLECYAVLDPDVVLHPGVERPLLCWSSWPVRNRVQAFTAAATVVAAAILEAVG